MSDLYMEKIRKVNIYISIEIIQVPKRKITNSNIERKIKDIVATSLSINGHLKYVRKLLE